MENSLGENHLYGDALSLDLKMELATRHGIATEMITVAGGIDELLGWIARVFLNPGDPVTASLGSYPTFHYHVEGFGGRLHKVPYRGGKTTWTPWRRRPATPAPASSTWPIRTTRREPGSPPLN